MTGRASPEIRVLPREIPPDAAPRSFFRRPTRTVARQILGAWLVRRSEGEIYAARIVEVEAYLGAGDAAAHSRGGRRTERVEPMWGDGGLLYVFQVYGIHFCANVVTGRAGRSEAVLLRAARHPRAPLSELSGPGRLARAFGLSREHSGLDLVGNREWEIRPQPFPRASIVTSPRIGVDYAGEAASWPLRYSIRGDRAVSRPRPKA